MLLYFVLRLVSIINCRLLIIAAIRVCQIVIEIIINQGLRLSKLSVQIKNVVAIPITKPIRWSFKSSVIVVTNLIVLRNKRAPSPPKRILLRAKYSKSLEQKNIITKYSNIESIKSKFELSDYFFNAIVIAIPKIVPGAYKSGKISSPLSKR